MSSRVKVRIQCANRRCVTRFYVFANVHAYEDRDSVRDALALAPHTCPMCGHVTRLGAASDLFQSAKQ